MVVGCVWLISSVVGEAIQETSLGHRAELFSYDLRFRLRGELPDSGDCPIVLVVIDEDSFERISEPLILWQGHFAQVLDRLVDAGASAVGIDLILPDVSELDPNGQRGLVGSLLGAEGEGVPVRLVYRIGKSGSAPASPMLAMAIGQEGFAFANLTTDEDDFVRRQELFAQDGEGQSVAGFAASLALTRMDSIDGARALDPILINYRGPDPFPRIPFWTVLEEAAIGGRPLRELVSGKIVLIGLYDEGDLHPTPLYFWPPQSVLPFRRTPGLAIHANTLNTLIEGNYLEPVSLSARRALTFLLVLAVTLLAWKFPPLPAALQSGGLVGGYCLFALTWAFSSGSVYFVVGPVTGALAAFALSQSAQYVLVGKEKRRLRSLFGRYVNESVIEELMQRHEALVLGGEKRSVSILFSDIRDFTTLTEKSVPEELVALLNRYLEAMVYAIHSHGGMVDKFIGDAVMAVFGAPVPTENHAVDAVRAASAMRSALARLNRQLRREGLPELRTGIGIHSGEAIIGNVGSPDRLEYTAIGDAVNTAARLESLTKQYSAPILVSRATFEQLSGTFSGESLGEVQLKGKATLVEVIRIREPQSDQGNSQSTDPFAQVPSRSPEPDARTQGPLSATVHSATSHNPGTPARTLPNGDTPHPPPTGKTR